MGYIILQVLPAGLVNSMVLDFADFDRENITDTVDGCAILHHLGWLKPYKLWDKTPINWCRISQPPTVSPAYF